MLPSKSLLCLFILAACTLTASCSSSNDFGAVSGTVTVDDKPVETGTIHFQASGRTAAAAAGAAVTDGKFELTPKARLTAGAYSVALQAFRKTGRVMNDPQRGKVPETTPVAVIDSPKSVEVSRENAGNLKINFSTSKP